jgi:uncharacterized protein involved in outer membrane biogenesis
MRSLHWLWLPVGVFGLLLMFALGPGTVWINAFCHSDAFRHEVESRASQSAGGQVEIKQIDFSVWSGVQLSGVATKLDSNQGVIVAQVEKVTCSYSLFALLERRLQLDGVTLVNPQIVLTQQPPSTVATPSTSSPRTTPSSEAPSGRTPPFAVVLEKARIIDGRLSIRDASAVTKADLQGVQVSAKTGGFYTGKELTGTLRIATVSLPQNLSLTDFSTPFTYQAGAVAAGPFEATAFGGKLTGHYQLDPGSPSQLEVNGTGLDVSQIGRSASPDSSTRLSGSLALQSKWSGVETGKLTGEGDAQITDGKLEGVSILHDLASILRVGALSDPDLKSVTIHFQVANGSTHFTDLRIESTVFEMTGSGVIDAQGGLDADMVLSLHADAMGTIPRAASSVFSILPGGGGSIPFHLGGTASHPEADLSNLFLQSPRAVEKILNKTILHFFH